MTSPTQQSLKKLRKEGYDCQVVERWNPWSHTRLDLFGCIDIVGIRENCQGVLGIQATSGSNISNRLQKCRQSKILPVWLKAGNRFQIWGWAAKCQKRKDGIRGHHRKLEVDIREITLSDFNLADN